MRKKIIFALAIFTTAAMVGFARPKSAYAMTLIPQQVQRFFQNHTFFREQTQAQKFHLQADGIEKRLHTHEDNLQSLIDRMKQRMDIMHANGKDTTLAEADLATAQQDLHTATSQGDAAVAALRAITPENWANRKADAQSAKQSLRAAQQALVHVVKDLRTTIQDLKTLQ